MAHYYDIEDDLKLYPEAVFIFVVGGRNTGKTYSALRYSRIKKHERFGFIKRTNDDVDFLCKGGGKISTATNNHGIDTSPFKSINRDFGTNVRAYGIDKGFGGFWDCNDDNEPIGNPCGYILSLYSVSRFKGFDLSDIEVLYFDEFIPNVYDRIINRNEGNQVLDLYKTISRDRIHRGKPPLKLICLANATRVSNPLFNTFELTDIAVDMQANNIEYYYDEEKKILLHILSSSDEFMEVESKDALYIAMKDTAWGQMAYENTFGYDDFSDIRKNNIKHFRPLLEIKYKNKYFYIYSKDGVYYATKTRSNKVKYRYNLNRESEQKRFYDVWYFKFRQAVMNGRIQFENYTYYDLIINFKKFFKIT